MDELSLKMTEGHRDDFVVIESQLGQVFGGKPPSFFGIITPLDRQTVETDQGHERFTEDSTPRIATHPREGSQWTEFQIDRSLFFELTRDRVHGFFIDMYITPRKSPRIFERVISSLDEQEMQRF